MSKTKTKQNNVVDQIKAGKSKKTKQKIAKLIKRAVNWVWQVPVPYMVLIGISYLAGLKTLQTLQAYAKDDQNMNVIIGGLMVAVGGLVINRLAVLLTKRK